MDILKEHGLGVIGIIGLIGIHINMFYQIQYILTH